MIIIQVCLYKFYIHYMYILVYMITDSFIPSFAVPPSPTNINQLPSNQLHHQPINTPNEQSNTQSVQPQIVEPSPSISPENVCDKIRN